MAREPFLGVPEGNIRTENPDGVFLRNGDRHSLYDTTPPINEPLIPGDYDNNREVTNPNT